MLRLTVLIVLIIVMLQKGFGQIPEQNIRVYIKDEYTHQAITNVAVQLFNEKESFQTQSDSSGLAIFKVAVGRYQMELKALGYQGLLITEILLETGKSLTDEITLVPTNTDIEAILITSAPTRMNPLDRLISNRVISVEQTRRFPATFFDPARLASASAGVVSVSDQANNIVVRGNNPNGLAWFLEGMEIVNPNHLSNAGTYNDRITQSGGGVNILSAQLLDNTSFMSGNFPASYGNATSGIMDMSFRKGNSQDFEYTAQLGVIGIEFAAEGPLDRKSGSSFLVNYRYSTLGLLGLMGVDLGDEAISFQDIAFQLDFPLKKRSILSIFGMAGESKNEFKASLDSLGFTEDKNRFDIDFSNKMMAVGAKLKTRFGSKSKWNNSIAISGLDSEREARRFDDQLLNVINQDTDELNEIRFSFHSRMDHRFNYNNLLTVGLRANQQTFKNDRIKDNVLQATGDGNGTLIQPYFNYRNTSIPKLVANLGLHYMHYTFNGTQNIEPRASFRYQLNEHHNFNLAYGLHSRLQPAQLYFAQVNDENPNEYLDFSKSHHLAFGWNYFFKSNYKFTFETYYQSLFDIPIERDTSSSFSTINLLDAFLNRPLYNDGTGKNYGVELTLEKYIHQGYYYLVNATVYQSTFKGGDGVERDTRFNGNYIFNLTAGKEFSWIKKSKKYILGINLRTTYLGGFRERAIDEVASAQAEETIYVSNIFINQQPNFFKADLRIYYKRNKKKFNSTLSLDIQNVTNAKNEAFNYYDSAQEQIVTKFQLGIIPILNYRIEF